MVSSNFFVASLIIEMTIGTFNFHTSWLISFELDPCKIRAQLRLLIRLEIIYVTIYIDITRSDDPSRCLSSFEQADKVRNVFLRIWGLVPRKMSEASGSGRGWDGVESCYVPCLCPCPVCVCLSSFDVSCQTYAPPCVLPAIFIIIHCLEPTHNI